MAKRKKNGRVGIALIAIIALIICGVIIYKTMELNNTLDAKQTELAMINAKIEQAQQKTEDINNEIKYRHTYDYIEDEARDKLGLTYPDEVILVPEEEGNK